MKGNTGEIHMGSKGELYSTLITMQGQKPKQGVKNKVGPGVPEYISGVIEKDTS